MSTERTEKIFKCKDCGNEFSTTANHALYCKDCARKRQFERAKIYREKKKNLQPTRAIGSMDICPDCGQEYMVKSGSQKVCENCRKKHENKRKSKTNAAYIAKTYDSILVVLKKGKKEEIQNKLEEYKESTGTTISVNEFISRSIDAMLENLDTEINSRK